MARPKDTQTWIWWDLTEYGSNNLQAVCIAQMKMLWGGAQALVDNHPPENIDELIEEQTKNLQREASRGLITDEWTSRAVLLVALKGLKGHKIPWHLNSQD